MRSTLSVEAATTAEEQLRSLRGWLLVEGPDGARGPISDMPAEEAERLLRTVLGDRPALGDRPVLGHRSQGRGRL
ncbi:hypothetical protein JCM4914_73310 [Streptomyces platensis subsp. malvinus]